MQKAFSEFKKFPILNRQQKLELMASTIEEAIQTLAPLIFNAQSFEVKVGVIYGFHAFKVHNELVKFEEPISLESNLP